MSLALVPTPDEHLVAMSGVVSPGTVIALYRTITAAVDDGHRVIVIDLSAVTFLGAQTAGLFCGTLRLLERRGVVVEVLGGAPRLQRMLAAGPGSPDVTQRPDHESHHRLEAVGDVAAGNAAFADPSNAGTAA